MPVKVGSRIQSESIFQLLFSLRLAPITCAPEIHNIQVQMFNNPGHGVKENCLTPIVDQLQSKQAWIVRLTVCDPGRFGSSSACLRCASLLLLEIVVEG